MDLGMHMRPLGNRRITVAIHKTQYSVIKKIVKGYFRWTILEDTTSDNWDIMWQDSYLQPQKLLRLRGAQKINHFAGIFQVAKKHHLWNNLNILRRIHPEDYDFYPKTWALPQDYTEFDQGYESGKTYIAKPQGGCQGKGIYLFQDLEDMPNGDKIVVQEYLPTPYLLDGLKFDFRIYVLVTSVNPLRIFIYEEGLARFATWPYVEPNAQNLWESWMHLTNYSLNKYNPQFQHNQDEEIDDEGHKRSLNAVFQILEDKGIDIDNLWDQIQQIIIKTMIAVQPHLVSVYNANSKDDIADKCFQILGFDILLDHSLKPWLLEVNQTPSFSTESPLDYKIKYELIRDTLALVNDFHVTRAAQRPTTAWYRKTAEQARLERIKISKQVQQSIELHEQENIGGFTKIYPLGEETQWYEPFARTAQDAFLAYESQMRQKAKKIDPKSPFSSRAKNIRHTDLTVQSVLPVMEQQQIKTLEEIKAERLQKAAYKENPDLVRRITFSKIDMTPMPAENRPKQQLNSKQRYLTSASTTTRVRRSPPQSAVPVPPPKLTNKGSFLRGTNLKLANIQHRTPRFRTGTLNNSSVKTQSVSDPRRAESRTHFLIVSSFE